MSIFSEYYADKNFEDRYQSDKNISVDVIIPTINTNELWYVNLLSFYREIPINRLLIGDGGCTDDTIEIAQRFPRVEVFNQQEYTSQGYAIKELIMNVETDYFIYLHADVYLPDGWYDAMYTYKNKYEWFECRRRMTILFEYLSMKQHKKERAYSGSQFGNTSLMQECIKDTVDDDYLQRNEDIILMELIREAGGSYGKIENTFHYHQTMNKKGDQEPDIKSVSIAKHSDKEWEEKIYNMQYKGIIKYLEPKKYLLSNIFNSILELEKEGKFDWKEFKRWVEDANPSWLEYVNKRKFYMFQFKKVYKGFKNVLLSNTSIKKFLAKN